MNEELRQIPAVDTLIEQISFPDGTPRALRTFLIRSHLDQLRSRIQSGASCPEPSTIGEEILDRARRLHSNRIQPVINATGVVLHTNLGRAPYAREVAGELKAVVEGYCNVEMDLSTGDRGGRGQFAETLLATITGGEAAGIVNNCSAALHLALKTFAEDRDVLISRGELVQIGGGFRIPEILEASGASLREVGTTNRTSIQDYRKEYDEDVSVILRVHPSNFRIQGFTESPSVPELSGLARELGVPFLCDLGSGALWDTSEAGLRPEPRPRSMIEQGADVVMFSGDKLMGGPQSGLFVGKRERVQDMKQHPLFRALRCGKATLTSLESTLALYAADGGRALPVQQLLRTPQEDLRQRAEDLMDRLDHPAAVESVEVEGTVGGGSLPGESIPGWGLVLDVPSPREALSVLREQDPPLVGRIEDDRVVINLRSVFPRQDAALETHLRTVLADK